MENVVIPILCPFWDILRLFGMCHDQLVYSVVIWYIFPPFGKLC
jgi:hypothetical protein